MTDAEYKAQLDIALLAVRGFYILTKDINFSGILERMERADAIGPLIDPTLWIRGQRGLKSQRQTIESAAKFKAALIAQLEHEDSQVTAERTASTPFS